MAQRSSPILPITSGIGAVSPVNVGGPGSAEEAFRNEQGFFKVVALVLAAEIISCLSDTCGVFAEVPGHLGIDALAWP